MKKIILIDGNSMMYRAYYATAATGNLMQNSKGIYTNMVYTFNNIFENIINTNFDKILVAFDKGKKTFRHDLVESYKDGRKPMPEEMRMQIPYLREYLKYQGIPIYELELYEADDIIGTVSRMAKEENYQVEIYSSDKDLFQLIDDNVYVNMVKTGSSNIERLDKEKLYEKYNLYNYQMIDFKTLMGDPSDNIKGVPKIGLKTAVKLLNEYDNLENIFNNIDKIKGSIGLSLKENKEQALTDKKIVTINKYSPIKINLSDMNRKEVDINNLLNLYKELEFKSLLVKYEKELRKENKKEINLDYKIIESEFELLNILDDCSFYLELDQNNYHKANFIGLAIITNKGNYYLDNFDNYYNTLKDFFENENIKKKTFDFKKDLVFLKYHNIDLKGVVFDLLLSTYIINPSLIKNEFKDICLSYSYDFIDYDENIYGKKDLKNIDLNTNYILQIIKKGIAIKELENNSLEIIKNNNQLELLNLELELSKVLADMEYQGVCINLEELNNQENNLNKRIKELEEIIYKLASTKFNISSPKQLGVVLFEKLNLPNIKKNKTGYSTDISVLNKLKDKHEIINYLIEYRSLTKLYNTYIIGIKNLLNKDNKLHTIFNQTLTQTGRLSSIEPNLQNIPIRTEEGSFIRKFFIPSPNSVLISSDYSQIELRVLSSLANVSKMIDYFNNDYDIHKMTAKEIFKTDEVSDFQRRSAKAVNFGIIYGISSYGLSEDLDIPIKDADNFIKHYFLVFPEIKTYMDNIIEECKKNGYITTIMNRRRYIPEIKSNNYNLREFGKRAAMNAVIQGSAADILKKAMIDIYNDLNKNKLKSKLIITVHDEVIIDCKKDELEKVKDIVLKCMNNSIKLKVPLKVSLNYGGNWLDAK